MKLSPFLTLGYWIARNSIKTLKKQSLLKIYFVLGCSLLFLLAEFFICYKAFSFVRDFPGVGSILSDRLMYLFYFVLFIMLIFSNAIVTYAAFYRSRDTELLFSYPLDSSTIFGDKFIESTALSSWAFLVLLLPFMMSYGISNKASFSLYPCLFLFFIPFLIITSTLGITLSMFLVKMLQGKKVKVIICSIVSGIFIYFIYEGIQKMRMEDRAQSLEIFILNQMLPNVKLSHSPFLPSYWMAEAILKIARKEFRSSLFYFLLLLSTSLFFIEALTRGAQRWYRETWLEMRSFRQEKMFLPQRGIIEKLRPLWALCGKDVSGLITKDMKLFWRDPVQWSQFVIFFGILGAYFLNLRNFSYNMLEPFWKNLCAFLNLSAILLTLGSLSTRFIFPQMSLEGARFWIIGLCPMGFKKVLYTKFWLNSFTCLIIAESLLIISNKMLGISGMIAFCFIWVTCVMSFALVALATGFGAAFPDFKSENPTKIVSGFGGTLTLMMSIIFIIIVLIFLIAPFQLFLKGVISRAADLKRAVFFSMGLISLCGAGLCILSLLYGERRLRAMEF